MAEILQLAHHPQVDRVPEVEIGRGAVDAVLDPQRPPGREPFDQFGLADDGVGGTA